MYVRNLPCVRGSVSLRRPSLVLGARSRGSSACLPSSMGSVDLAADACWTLAVDALAPGWVALEAGIYDVEVSIGPTFRSSGFDEVDVDDPSVRGRVVRPSASELREWATLICDSVREGCDFRGGWAPDRSAVVVWHGSDVRYYYKCNDGGAFDLAWQPALAGPWTMHREVVCTRVHLQFYTQLRRERGRLYPGNVPCVRLLGELDAEIGDYRRGLQARGINVL